MNSSQWSRSVSSVCLRLHVPGVLSLVAAGAIALAFSCRFGIVLPQQPAEIECLNARAFLIDRWDRDVKPGALVAFRLDADNAVFKKGTGLIKLVAAVEGQRYVVNESGVVADDWSVQVDSAGVIKKFGLDPHSIYRSGTVEAGRFFAVGERPTSYDSRYWGTAPAAGVVGRAYALF